MNKVKAFLKNDQIQLAFVSGLCIIILALIFKKVMHIQVSAFDSALPALIFTFGEAVLTKHKASTKFWARLWFWNTLMLFATGIVILRRLYF